MVDQNVQFLLVDHEEQPVLVMDQDVQFLLADQVHDDLAVYVTQPHSPLTMDYLGSAVEDL